MASEIVQKLLEELKSSQKFDESFLDILKESNSGGKDGKTTSLEIIGLIRKRYDKSKENKT